MKKSARLWVVAFAVSLLPSIYLGAIALGLAVALEQIYDYVSLAAGLLCTYPIWQSAFSKGRSTKLRFELLTLSGLLISYGYSFAAQDHNYYWQSASLTTLLLASGWITTAQITKMQAATPKLAGLVPTKASLIDGREIEHVETSTLEIGQVVLVRPGTSFPADGFVIQGESLVSQKLITGELEPIFKVPGDWVLAGSENLPGRGSGHGALTVRISGIGNQLLIHELEQSLEQEHSEPAKYSKFGRVMSGTLLVFGVAGSLAAAGIALILEHGLAAQFSTAVSVLIATQLAVAALAAPLASRASAIKLAALGVLVGKRSSFEALAKINHVVFNKTGTLTRGYNSVGTIHLARNTSIGTENELLALAASVEMGTSHELGHLIIQEAVKRGLELPQVSDIAPIPGLGVSARFDGSLVQVGNAGMVNVSGINMNPYDLFRVSNAYQEGSSVVFVSIDELLVGYIEFPDEIRANSQAAIVELSGKRAITVLSGDATAVVERVTKSLGLSEFAAEVLATRKADWIKEKKASGSRILLVADGHYDAAALAEADVALAFGAGHDIHLSSADIVQVSQDPLTVAKLVKLATKTQSRTFWNVIFATLVSFGLMAAGVLGVFAPIIAAAGMVFSWLMLRSIVRLVK